MDFVSADKITSSSLKIKWRVKSALLKASDLWAATVPRNFSSVTRGLSQGEILAESSPLDNTQKNLRNDCESGCEQVHSQPKSKDKSLKTQKNNLLKIKRWLKTRCKQSDCPVFAFSLPGEAIRSSVLSPSVTPQRVLPWKVIILYDICHSEQYHNTNSYKFKVSWKKGKKIEIHLTWTWKIDDIQYFPVDRKQHFTNAVAKSVCSSMILPAPMPCETFCFVCFYRPTFCRVCVYTMDFVSNHKQIN